MVRYLPFLMVLGGFAALFVVSGGGFRASARFLLRKIRALAPYASEETLSRALLILFAANVLGLVMEYQAVGSDTAARGYLVRGAYGEADDTAQLSVEVGGETREVELSVRSRQMSKEEIRSCFEEAKERLTDLVRAAEADRGRDFTLPEKLDGLPVRISWMTDRPEILGFEGEIGENIPDEGAEVTLFAEISCEDESVEAEYPVRIYPASETREESFRRTVIRAVEESNSETAEKVVLPEELEGRPARWSFRNGHAGAILLLMGMMIAVVYLYSRIRLKELDEEERKRMMHRDYPGIVSKLVLLLQAGMSIRRALGKIRADYRRSLADGGRVRPGYEEIVRTSLDTERGVSEPEAYGNLGKRCGSPEYRTLAQLLSAGVVRGGSELADMLTREAASAFEERKKRARVLGEEAGTKLLLPMLLMLVVVMAILMVPALLAFL